MMAPPSSPRPIPGPQPPRQASAGDAVETAREATATKAINIFFMAVPFSRSHAGNLMALSSITSLECAMNVSALFADKCGEAHSCALHNRSLGLPGGRREHDLFS